MTISPSDQTWRAVAAWAKGEIETARDALEKPQSKEDADFTRGRIAQLRELLKLPAATTKPVINEVPAY